APGVAAARMEMSRSDADAARAAATAVVACVLALAVPVALLLLNGLRRPACDPLAGLWLYLAVAVPSGVLAAALGVAAGFFAAGRRLSAACGIAAALLWRHAERFHWTASVGGLDAELGGSLRTGHVVLHFPREKSDDERQLLARDAEVAWRAVREFAGLPLDGPVSHVFLYRNAEEKRRLIGAAETSFTKP